MGGLRTGARVAFSTPRASVGQSDADGTSSRVTKPDEMPEGAEGERLLPVASVGVEGSLSEESETLESLFASFPHLKTALAPSESGSARVVVTEDAEIKESDEEIKGARGARDGTSSDGRIKEGGAEALPWTPECEGVREES